MHNESLSNYEARRGDNIGALLHKLGTLMPGQTRRIITQLGQAPAREVREIVCKYRDEQAVDSNNDFGNYQQATKSGIKYHDLDADGALRPVAARSAESPGRR